MAKYHHKESDLQIRCVRYFRIQYPYLSCLFFHPKNEGNGNREQGAISKAEGVTPGVSDLFLQVPSESFEYNGQAAEEYHTYNALAIEMKSKTGSQSYRQKLFQRYFEAMGGKYIIIRDFEDFKMQIDKYVRGIPYNVIQDLKELYYTIQKEKDLEAKRELQRIINKQ